MVYYSRDPTTAHISPPEDCIELDLSNCNLSELPYYISDLPNLKWLYLDNNQLTDFNADLPNLKYLYLGNNQLTDFNADLPNLKRLDLENNQLTDLNAILPNLEDLNLRNNQLISFNTNLPNLEDLNLRNNQLTSFNTNLPNLERLRLSNLEDFPTLGSIDTLVWINYSENLAEQIKTNYKTQLTLKIRSSLDIHLIPDLIDIILKLI